MTNQQIRIKIAEILGWKPDDDGAGLNTWEASWVGNKLYGLKPRFNDSGKLVSYTVDCVVPNFPEDLNACHEFEHLIFGDWEDYSSLWHQYEISLKKVCGTRNHWMSATARQRCEAFLRVHRQWEE